MMKPSTQLKKIQEQIEAIKKNGAVRVLYSTRDLSVQAELRLSSSWIIRASYDAIKYPKDLSGSAQHLWGRMWDLNIASERAALLSEKLSHDTVVRINERRKDGPALRAAAKTAWLIESGKAFLAEYRKVTGKSALARVRKTIAKIQAEQKNLLSELRASNSEVVMGWKAAKEEQRRINAEALRSGEFWKADSETLKGYFHAPLQLTYVADVSEKWRACLILECQSTGWKGYDGNWRHKLVGTGRGYFCGIDDNGDEWGYVVSGLHQSHDDHDNAALDNTVEEAMGEVFEMNYRDLDYCTRQGDLLFLSLSAAGRKIITKDSPEHCEICGQSREKHTFFEIEESGEENWTCHEYDNTGIYGIYKPHVHKAPVLTPEESWEPRESHVITSPSLEHNGVYFRSADPIVITHTSHAAVILPAGEYRLYMSRAYDAD